MKLKSFFLSVCLHAALLGSPFAYDLDERRAPGVGTPTLCMHGYGGSGGNLLQALTGNHATELPLITFNFPNYDILHHTFTPENTCFGTIDELLPPLYLMKKTVVDEGNAAINLYGFSAGGGAVVNCLAVLNSDRFGQELETIGIGIEERKQILKAVQKGNVLLDVPLKSLDEVVDLHRDWEDFVIVAKRYRDQDLRPIDSLQKLAGLSLNIVLFFQSPDKVLANRDDALYIERLQKANVLGQTRVRIADEGGHSGFHPFIWE